MLGFTFGCIEEAEACGHVVVPVRPHLILNHCCNEVGVKRLVVEGARAVENRLVLHVVVAHVTMAQAAVPIRPMRARARTRAPRRTRECPDDWA